MNDQQHKNNLQQQHQSSDNQHIPSGEERSHNDLRQGSDEAIEAITGHLHRNDDGPDQC